MTGRLLLVGRDWGFHEHMARRPFVGPAGSLLNKGLKAAGLDRETECVVSNVVNQKPKGDEWRAHAPGAVAEGVKTLLALAQREQPPLIITLGEQALNTFLTGNPDDGRFRVTEVRGYIFPSDYGPVLCCVHPAFCLRSWFPWTPLLMYDLKKARRVFNEASSGGWGSGVSAARQYYTQEVVTRPPPLESVSQRAVTAIDIETTTNGIACIGWSWDVTMGWCAPYREDFFPWFHALLESDAPKVFQNGQFDTTILARHGFEVRNWQHDTMLLWHALEPMLAGKVTLGEGNESGVRQTHKGLRFLVSLLTDEPHYKIYDYKTEVDQYILCGKDARLTLECFLRMQEMLNVAR